MIVQIIIVFLLSFLTTIFSLFTLPAMPLEILQAINAVIGFIAVPLGIAQNYVGSAFLSGIFVVIIVYAILSPIYHISLWVYQRIRG